MVCATVDATAYSLCLVLALCVRLRFQHDGAVAGATGGAVGVGLGLHAAAGDVPSRSLHGPEQEKKNMNV